MDFDIVRFVSFISFPLLIPVVLFAIRKFLKKPVKKNPTPTMAIIFLLVVIITIPAQVGLDFKVAALAIEGIVYLLFWHFAYTEYKQNLQA